MEIQDVVGHDAWGMYAALFSLGYLFLAFADLGINPYTTQKLAAQPQSIHKHLSTLLSAKLCLLLIYPLLMLGIAYLLGYRQEELWMLTLLCMVHAGSQLMEFFRANFRALQKFKIDSFLSVFDRLFLLGLVIFLFYKGINIEDFIYARIISVTAGGVFFFILIWRLIGPVRLHWDSDFLRKAIKASLPFAMMTVLYSLHDKVDQVMIERLAGKRETGLYAAAYRWIDAFSMYLWTVLPIFFARFAFFIENKSEQRRLLNFGQLITSLPMMFIAVFGLFYGEKLLFLFDRSSAEDLEIMNSCLQVLFLALWVNGTFTIFSTLLTSTGHVKFVNKVIGISILLNIILNTIFIPEYGALASAWTTFVSFSLANVAYLWYAGNSLQILLPFRQVFLLCLLGILLYGTFLGLEQFSDNWYLNTSVAALVFTALILSFRMITLQDIRSFNV